MRVANWPRALLLASPLAHTAAVVAQNFKTPTNSRSGVVHSVAGRADPGAGTAEIDTPAGPKVVPNAYIVELDAGSSLGRRSTEGHARFHKRAQEADVEYEVRREFDDASLFYGISVKLDSDTDKEALEALPEVKRIWPVVEVARPVPVGLEKLDVGGPVAPEYGFNTSVIRGENYKLDFNLKMAGVEHLHSHGFKGKGVKVAIVDTGVDYNHPALGGGFGPGKKIGFGRNYIVDDGQGGADDPIASCAAGGHGSHVAGIVAGEDPKDKGFGLLGVAPEATLGMYRVFSCYGLAASDTIMQAMVDAIADGADIISMSLGSDSGWERLDPFGAIITNAKEQGVAVIVAAGNAGSGGPMLTGSPAIAKDAVAVASANSARYPTTYKVKGSSGGEWRYAGLWPLEGEYHVYAASDYDDSLSCSYESFVKAQQYVEEQGWDFEKTLLMVRKSQLCSISFVAYNAPSFGFSTVLAWRDQEFDNPEDNDYEASMDPFFTLSMNHIDGPKVNEAVAADPTGFRLKFSDRRFTPIDNTAAGFTSNFSTIGNTWEFNVFKPLISAPGHLILSAWPLEGGGYTIISGTSMATPFVAGCYALLKGAYPNLTVDEMTNLFTTTAQPSKFWGDSDVIHSVAHQGAGMINVWKAYNSGAKFETGALVLGQSAKSTTHNITFTNTLGRSKTFSISHEPAGLMQRTPYPELNAVAWNSYGFPSKPIYAAIEFDSPKTITLGPGEMAEVSFTVTPPQGVDPDTIPNYSGYVKFVSGNDVYTVPYQGLPYTINEVPVLERDLVTEDLLPAMVEEMDVEEGISYEDLIIYDVSKEQYVTMIYFARQPSDAYRLDLVAANTTFEPTYYGFNVSNVFETTTPDLPVIDDFGGAESFSLILDAPYFEPVYHILSWLGGLSDMDRNDLPYDATAGDYRWLLRILPVEKDPSDPESWESWLGPVIRFPVDYTSPW